MTLDDAHARLRDTTFLLGAFRRRAAIRALAEAPDAAGVLALAKALAEGHPSADRIRTTLEQLSPQRDADKLQALWAAWAASPNTALAAILSQLAGHPTGRWTRSSAGTYLRRGVWRDP